MNKLVNFNDNNCFTKKIEHKQNITNTITRHNHNNCELNAIKKVHKQINHIKKYDTEMNYYRKKSLNKKDYYNFYKDNLDFRKLRT